jgi:4-amino-4-deoxy-L-arabinose transferase-like glycosyltransferase
VSPERPLAVAAPGLSAPPPTVADAPAALAEPRGHEPARPRPGRLARVPTGVWVLAILALATAVRLWQINALGYNSDEAVYGGQGAAIANDPQLEPFFPAFRAHPLLFQSLLSVGYAIGKGEIFGRVASAAVGVATVYVVFLTGRLLYGRRTGLLAALFVALMPYHVIVTRQVLLDGPMVLFSTLTLYLVARWADSRRDEWIYAAGAVMGLALLSKETSAVLLGSLYAFVALTPALRVRPRLVIGGLACMGLVIAAFPIALVAAGQTRTGGNYLAWQLFRRANHGLLFYPVTVPLAMGVLIVVVAALGLWLLRRHGSWRETLLLSWIAVPVVFFEIWPVKGFQYLLPVAPAVALLGARTLTHASRWAVPPRLLSRRRALGTPVVARLATAAVLVSLAVPTWNAITPSRSTTFLAGSGGVPGGRETGAWIRANVPVGAQLLAIGPSMANIVQYYGHRKAYGLSVSPNPLHRNPAYEPVANPDRLIRTNELQYIVWDAFSAKRSHFFSASIVRYTERYHGRLVHQETAWAHTRDGHRVRKPIISVYEVRP